jgi:hypothetical protein
MERLSGPMKLSALDMAMNTSSLTRKGTFCFFIHSVTVSLSCSSTYFCKQPSQRVPSSRLALSIKLARKVQSAQNGISNNIQPQAKLHMLQDYMSSVHDPTISNLLVTMQDYTMHTWPKMMAGRRPSANWIFSGHVSI